jgi:hypothetical protein
VWRRGCRRLRVAQGGFLGERVSVRTGVGGRVSQVWWALPPGWAQSAIVGRSDEAMQCFESWSLGGRRACEGNGESSMQCPLRLGKGECSAAGRNEGGTDERGPYTTLRRCWTTQGLRDGWGTGMDRFHLLSKDLPWAKPTLIRCETPWRTA